jgi:predicted amidohydrolase
MFDVELGEGESYRESKGYRPGEQAVTADAPWGKLGLTICYDMRFPALYRALAEAGAAILTVPSAFTVPTGRDHWEVLLRARAIETGWPPRNGAPIRPAGGGCVRLTAIPSLSTPGAGCWPMPVRGWA